MSHLYKYRLDPDQQIVFFLRIRVKRLGHRNELPDSGDYGKDIGIGAVARARQVHGHVLCDRAACANKYLVGE